MYRTVRRSVPVAAVIGLLAPHVWVWLLGVMALSVSEPALKWLWSALAIKGTAAFTVVTLVESVAFGLLFAGVLRLAVGRAWPPASLAFSVAFVASFYVPGFLVGQGGGPPVFWLAPQVAGVLLFAVAFFAAFASLPCESGA